MSKSLPSIANVFAEHTGGGAVGGGVTIKQLALAAGCADQTIRNWINDEHLEQIKTIQLLIAGVPSVAFAAALARALVCRPGLRVEQIPMDGVTDMNRDGRTDGRDVMLAAMEAAHGHSAETKGIIEAFVSGEPTQEGWQKCSDMVDQSMDLLMKLKSVMQVARHKGRAIYNGT